MAVDNVARAMAMDAAEKGGSGGVPFTQDDKNKLDAIPDIQNRMISNLNLSVKATCPTNEVIYDDLDSPGIYVQRASKKLSELVTDGDDNVHPAFLVNEQQVTRLFIGKFQGKTRNLRICSLPGEDPTTSISLDTYETYCKNKGVGHHCITAAEWAYLALCAKKNRTMPLGNNDRGKDITETEYTAIPSMVRDQSGYIQRIATGSGPTTWSDTGDVTGIWDLNGNIWEWVSGIRLVKGELQMIPYNNAAISNCNTGVDSVEWRAINAKANSYDDLYLDPNGTDVANSVKLDMVDGHWQWQNTTIANSLNSNRGVLFSAITMSGLSNFCKMFLQAMALAPDGNPAEYFNDMFYANNFADERVLARGGSWTNGTSAGLFSAYFAYARNTPNAAIGSRPAFYEAASISNLMPDELIKIEMFEEGTEEAETEEFTDERTENL